MITGLGTDIISVARVQALISKPGSRFVDHWFSPEEITYCSSAAHPARHYAARLAAKEATAKALLLDSWAAVPWRGITVTLNARGIPGIRLSPEIRALIGPVAAGTFRVSLSHCDEFATATVIIEEPDRTIEEPDRTGAAAAALERTALQNVLEEFDDLRDADADPDLEAVRSAILLEDLTDVVLTDAQIDPVTLRGASSMVALVPAPEGVR